MKQKISVCCACLVLAGGLGCQFSGKKQSIRSYYFPLESLRTGKVYEFQSLENDTTEREYWYLRSFQTDSGMFLVTTFYDRYFRINQILREKIVENGSVAKQLFLYEPDFREGVEHKIEPTIEASSVFPFEVTDTAGIFLYKLHYPVPNDPASSIYLIRNRRFGGRSGEFSFKNKKHATVVFHLSEVLGHEKEGSAEGHATGEERYAEGLGLVYFSKTLGHGQHQFRRSFRLADVYPMSVLEKKARSVLAPGQ